MIKPTSDNRTTEKAFFSDQLIYEELGLPTSVDAVKASLLFPDPETGELPQPPSAPTLPVVDKPQENDAEPKKAAVSLLHSVLDGRYVQLNAGGSGKGIDKAAFPAFRTALSRLSPSTDAGKSIAEQALVDSTEPEPELFTDLTLRRDGSFHKMNAQRNGAELPGDSVPELFAGVGREYNAASEPASPFLAETKLEAEIFQLLEQASAEAPNKAKKHKKKKKQADPYNASFNIQSKADDAKISEMPLPAELQMQSESGNKGAAVYAPKTQASDTISAAKPRFSSAKAADKGVNASTSENKRVNASSAGFDDDFNPGFDDDFDDDFGNSFDDGLGDSFDDDFGDSFDDGFDDDFDDLSDAGSSSKNATAPSKKHFSKRGHK